MEVTFVHAADLHLGTPFKGLGKTQPWLKERLVTASFQAFKALVDLARDSDFLLMAGDILEVDYPHLRAQLELAKGLKILSREGVRVFMVAGNHDPYPFWRGVNLPPGVHLFPPQGGVEEMVLGGTRVSVSGVSHGEKRVRENLVRRLVPGGGDLRLALIHAYLQGQEGHDPYAPCALGDLVSRNFHYWALGHIHRRQEVMEDPWVIYPGNILGCHKGEGGMKGCYRVTWREEGLEAEFCPLSPVVWETRSLDVEGVEDAEALVELLEGLKEEVRWQGGTLLRVCLRGPSPLYALGQDSWGQVEDMLNEGEDREDFVWLILEDRLVQPLDLAGLTHGEDFLACLVEEARRLEKEMEGILEEGELSLLWGRRDVIRWIGSLPPEERDGLVTRAMKRALALMLGEG